MPFKSDKQRRYLSMASGGMIKKAVTNAFGKQGSLQDYARMRSGGIIKQGSKTPGKVVKFEQQCLKKFKDS